jgi:myo-inositol catabolism protein IolC
VTTFILAVDHRKSLREWLGSLEVPAGEIEQTARRLKTLCVEALGIAQRELELEETPMLLLDDEYGADAIAQARRRDLPVVIPAERSGQAEFLFEHGDRFREAIDAVDPYAVKALVRYNTEGDAEVNDRSRSGLITLQEYVRDSGRRFMLEVLVPATADQRAEADGDRFDEDIRPALTVKAIDELVAAGLRPDWWKLEGNRDPGAAAVVAVAASEASDVGCLVLGRGQERERVDRWVEVAASVGGYVGFAVGRTLWTDPFKELVTGQIDEEGAARRIAASYLDIAAVYRRAADKRCVSNRDKQLDVWGGAGR